MKLISSPHEAVPSAQGASTDETPLVPLARWLTERHAWPAGQRVGVTVPNDQDVTVLREDLPKLDILALEFPKWTDGRAYSQARLLRSRLRFGGEVRAVGEVMVDMLPLLQRTGFDAAQLRPGQNLDSARRVLQHFAGHYQGDALEPRPQFARLETV